VNKVSRYFDDMKALCANNNATFMVMYVPGQIEVAKPTDMTYYPYAENVSDTNEFSFNRPQNIVKDLCAAKQINFLNTTSYLKTYPTQPVYFNESWHWNKEGHKAAAAFLADYFNKDIFLAIQMIRKIVAAKR